MNEFRLRESGAVVTEQAFRAMHNASFPQVIDAATLNAYDADPILAAPAPAITNAQTVSRNGVVLDGLGNWVHAWKVDAIPAEVIAASLVTERNTLVAKIDADVDLIYAAVMGNRVSEYALAEDEALAYQAAGYPITVPASVQGWAAAKVQTAAWAADSIIATAAAWRAAQGSIRGERLLRKEQAKNAIDVVALETVKTQWSGFVTAVRGQLGL